MSQLIGTGFNHLVERRNNGSTVVSADFLHVLVHLPAFALIQFGSGIHQQHWIDDSVLSRQLWSHRVDLVCNVGKYLHCSGIVGEVSKMGRVWATDGWVRRLVVGNCTGHSVVGYVFQNLRPERDRGVQVCHIFNRIFRRFFFRILFVFVFFFFCLSLSRALSACLAAVAVVVVVVMVMLIVWWESGERGVCVMRRAMGE